MKNNLSSLRSRRFTAKKQKKTRQIIAFRLSTFWFALPILSIEKVVNLDAKDINKDGKLAYIEYRDRKLRLINTAQVIFNDKSPPKKKSSPQQTAQQYIVILGTKPQSSIGLPIDSQPIMYRPKISDFKPLNQANLKLDALQCLNEQVVMLSDLPPILLLNSQKLIESYI